MNLESIPILDPQSPQTRGTVQLAADSKISWRMQGTNRMGQPRAGADWGKITGQFGHESRASVVCVLAARQQGALLVRTRAGGGACLARACFPNDCGVVVV